MDLCTPGAKNITCDQNEVDLLTWIPETLPTAAGAADQTPEPRNPTDR
jgi:hypothetical protein